MFPPEQWKKWKLPIILPTSRQKLNFAFAQQAVIVYFSVPTSKKSLCQTPNINVLANYEGRSISNAPDPLPIAVEQRNLAQLLVFLYIGTTQSYA